MLLICQNIIHETTVVGSWPRNNGERMGRREGNEPNLNIYIYRHDSKLVYTEKERQSERQIKMTHIGQPETIHYVIILLLLLLSYRVCIPQSRVMI